MKANEKFQATSVVDVVSAVNEATDVVSEATLDITSETTLNEILQACKQARTKARKRPSVAQLQKKACRVARFVDDELSYKILVYRNGYAT